MAAEKISSTGDSPPSMHYARAVIEASSGKYPETAYLVTTEFGELVAVVDDPINSLGGETGKKTNRGKFYAHNVRQTLDHNKRR